VTGPDAPPGRYQVRLTIGGHDVATRGFRLLPDPRSTATPADYAAQFAMEIRIRDRVSDANRAVTRIRDLRDQLDNVMTRAAGTPAADTLKPIVDSLKRRLTTIEEAIYQTKNRSGQDPLNYPIRLNNRIGALMGVVSSADGRPTQQSYDVYKVVSSELATQLTKLRAILAEDLPKVNAMLRAAGLKQIEPTGPIS
jgi:hypothetical protein